MLFFMAMPPYDGKSAISRNHFGVESWDTGLIPGCNVTRHGLRRFGILRTFDLVDFPGSVIGSAESSDGEFVLVADLVEGVLPLGDRVEIFFQAEVVGG
jgi:hypothetical protein